MILNHSFIIPVYNEKQSLKQLLAELMKTISELSLLAEIIFVDDGSTDGSSELLDSMAEANSRVRVIHFSRNFGKSAAYMAGFYAANGEILITLDSDLQDVPSETPKLLAALAEGHDLVIGMKKGRLRNEPHKTVPSRLYNGLKRRLFGLSIHDSNSGYRAMKRVVTEGLNLYGDQYRFIPELAHLRGFRVTEVPVRHRQRRYGSSKYGPLRFWTGMLDIFSVRFLKSFSFSPLHFFGTIAVASAGFGGLLEIYVLYAKIAGDTFREHMAALIIGVMFILIGFQFFGIGLVGEMISALQRGPQYHVRKRIGFDEDASGSDDKL